MKLWESDPAFKVLRDEYLASLPERADALDALLSHAELTDEDRKQLRFVVHKIAGLAGSYGLVKLGKVCGVLDDAWGFSGRDGSPGEAEICAAHSFVAAALREASRTGEDAEGLAQDPVVAKITFYVESLLAASTS